MASSDIAAVEAGSSLECALKELLALAGLPPVETLSAEEVQAAVNQLKIRLASLPEPGSAPDADFSNRGSELESKTPAVAMSPRQHKKILLVGQVGIILHQLKHLLIPTGAEILLARDLGEALLSYQQERPSLIVIDLCMPTAREGLALLQAIRQLVRNAKVKPEPTIIMLSSSSKDEPVRGLCQENGANLILERLEGWQQTIVEICQGSPKAS